MLRGEIRDYYWQYRLTPDLIELRNLADVASALARQAAGRRRGRQDQAVHA